LIASLVAALAVASASWAASRPAAPHAQSARTLVANDEGRLRKTKESGADLIEEGPATGTLPGWVRVKFNIGATIKASFILYPRGGGSISGNGSGALHSTKRYASFGGHMSVTHGTGRYSHAHGSGGFYGVVDRDTLALTVQTRGTLHY
jgi:hypothetical protein